MVRVSVVLSSVERDALVALAKREFRDPRAQAALIIVRELERAGLLPAVIETQSRLGEVRDESRGA